ncbi:MAG: SGNH/GDSL hydrolase family protein [Acutalibacteraceae bacterium]|nr:SGNH/GDSL hydrolase family protein [Acutalibacteraceae bacterium]
MKKAILLGDSIREWYTLNVAEELKGKVEVIWQPGDNGRFAAYSYAQLSGLLKEHGKVDIVHFNTGYWDMNTVPFLNENVFPTDEYTYYLRKIIRLSRAAGAKVVFATTTPLPGKVQAKDNTGTDVDFSFEDDLVLKYNEAALELMKEENVPVNDLYAICKKHENYYKCEDNLHHSAEGNAVLGMAVADFILKELGME